MRGRLLWTVAWGMRVCSDNKGRERVEPTGTGEALGADEYVFRLLETL